jgi:hypothetical protein
MTEGGRSFPAPDGSLETPRCIGVAERVPGLSGGHASHRLSSSLRVAGFEVADFRQHSPFSSPSISAWLFPAPHTKTVACNLSFQTQFRNQPTPGLARTKPKNPMERKFEVEVVLRDEARCAMMIGMQGCNNQHPLTVLPQAHWCRTISNAREISRLRRVNVSK